MRKKFLLEFHRTAAEVDDWDHMSWQAIEGRSRKWNDENLKEKIYRENWHLLVEKPEKKKKLIKMSSIINIRSSSLDVVDF